MSGRSCGSHRALLRWYPYSLLNDAKPDLRLFSRIFIRVTGSLLLSAILCSYRGIQMPITVIKKVPAFPSDDPIHQVNTPGSSRIPSLPVTVCCPEVSTLPMADLGSGAHWHHTFLYLRPRDAAESTVLRNDFDDLDEKL